MPHKQNIKTLNLAGITGSQTAVKVENPKKKRSGFKNEKIQNFFLKKVTRFICK